MEIVKKETTTCFCGYPEATRELHRISVYYGDDCWESEYEEMIYCPKCGEVN